MLAVLVTISNEGPRQRRSSVNLLKSERRRHAEPRFFVSNHSSRHSNRAGVVQDYRTEARSACSSTSSAPTPSACGLGPLSFARFIDPLVEFLSLLNSQHSAKAATHPSAASQQPPLPFNRHGSSSASIASWASSTTSRAAWSASSSS